MKNPLTSSPGTSVAACGEGRKDAIAGVLGQLAGALVFVAAYGWLEPLIKLGEYGQVTLHGLTGTSPWLWIALAAAAGAAAWYFGRSRPDARHATPLGDHAPAPP